MTNASRRSGRGLALLVLGLGLPAAARIGLRIPNTIQFFSMMSQAPAWTEFNAAYYDTEAFPLEEYETIAPFSTTATRVSSTSLNCHARLGLYETG